MSNELPAADRNLALVIGTATADSSDRELPDGTVVRSFDVVAPGLDGSRSTVPVAWHEPPTNRAPVRSGARIAVLGHVRRRFFRVGGATNSRTEVVASLVAPDTSTGRARVRRALERSLE